MLASPPAQIVLARAIAGVRLGSSRAAIAHTLGKGKVTGSGTGSFGPYTTVAYRTVYVTYVKGVATLIGTRSAAYRTSSGVAVGTSEKRLRAAYGSRLGCGNYLVCSIGDPLPGRAITIFQLKNGRVLEIDVQSVLD